MYKLALDYQNQHKDRGNKSHKYTNSRKYMKVTHKYIRDKL